MLPLPSFSNIVAGIAVIAIAALGWFVYQAGSDSRDAEIAAMRKANDRAITLAEKGLREDLASAIFEKKRLENEAVRLDAEADADPAAARECLSVERVRRIKALD